MREKRKAEQRTEENGLRTISYGKWLAVFAGVVCAGLLCAAGLTAAVDPFFHYHAPLEGFPYLVDDQVDQNPGMARHLEYDSVLLGSSMTVNFNMDWFQELLGRKTVKLSYNGAFPKDQDNILRIIFDARGDRVKEVFLGIDEMNYSADVNATKFPITPYLYDENPFNDLPYLFNKDVLLDYILRPLADRKDASDWNNLYKPWWQDEHYQKALVLMYYEPAQEAGEEVAPETFLPAIEANLSANICPYIEAHPETTFTIFYPPYSILYWNDVLREKELDAVIRKLEYMTERLLPYENVRIFSFIDAQEIITDLNNYADYTHYNWRISRYITECFANGERELTPGNYKQRFAALKELAANYDYAAIWDDWYN